MTLQDSQKVVRTSAERADLFLAGAAWVVVVLACIQLLMFGHGRDQSIYAVVADTILQGGMPYRDAWDFKPPGIFMVFAFAQACFGKTMVSVRIVEVAGFVGAVFAYRGIAKNVFGSALPGLVGGALALLIHAELDFWHTGQPEAFGGILTAFALAQVTGRGVMAERTADRVAAWIIAGMLFGAAFLMKPPLGGVALPAALYVCIAEWRRTRKAPASVLPALTMGAASLLPLALCAAWFAARGAWPALSWTLFEFTPGYTKLGWTSSMSGLFRYAVEEAVYHDSYVIPAGLALLVVLPRTHARERPAVALVVAVALVQLFGVALQAKFFQYHYSATLPLLAFLAGAGLTKAWRLVSRIPRVSVPLHLAFVIALGVAVYGRTATPMVPGTFWERCLDRLSFVLFHRETREALDRRLYRAADFSLGADRTMAEEIVRRTAPGDSLFVWGFEPLLYWLSERRPSSPYVYNVPQRVVWERQRARDELLADLQRDMPRAIVVQHDDYFKFVTGDDLDSARALHAFPELEDLVTSRYKNVGRTMQFELYLRE